MKLGLRVFLGLAMALAVGFARAGNFEGEVDMKMSRPDSDKSTLMYYFVKGQKIRFEVNTTSDQGKVAGIMDLKTKQMIMIMDKQKMYMVSEVHPEKFHYNNDKHFKITKTGRTEKILGYTCQEWDYTSDDNNGKIWMAPGIGNWWANEMAAQSDKLPADQKALVQTALDQKLFPMKYETDDKSGKVLGTMEVIKVEKKSLNSSMFEAPAGYKKLDMGKLLGGQNNKTSGTSVPSTNTDPLSNVKPKLPF